jgi:hypothetical protein
MRPCLWAVRWPQLHGRPVVTGKERGMAASMSYEAYMAYAARVC